VVRSDNCCEKHCIHCGCDMHTGVKAAKSMLKVLLFHVQGWVVRIACVALLGEQCHYRHWLCPRQLKCDFMLILACSGRTLLCGSLISAAFSTITGYFGVTCVVWRDLGRCVGQVAFLT
jgi:hypothetical protein